MMLDLEEVSDYLDTRGLHTEVTKVVDKFETHFEELKRAKKDVMAKGQSMHVRGKPPTDRRTCKFKPTGWHSQKSYAIEKF